ncbi:hypothetical protein KVP10_08475 [Candidimonas humi]|nr:hypothetical protein [Candidimonas humi]
MEVVEISFAWLLLLILIGLKLAGVGVVAAWPWVWILSPLWVLGFIILSFVVPFSIAIAIRKVWGRR